MKNQKNGHHKIADRNKPLLHTEGTTQEYICQEKHEESQKTLEDRIKISDRWMIRLTAALVFVSMVSAAIYYFQLRAMKTQADIMQGQLITAQDSIKIAKNTLEDARKSGEEQSARAERLTKSNEKIAQASKQSVETAKDAAKKSLDATIDNFHLEQRAWVGVTTIEPPKYTDGNRKVYIKEGQPFTLRMFLTNSGRTPAQKLSNLTEVHKLPVGVTPVQIGTKPTATADKVAQPGEIVDLITPPLLNVPNKVFIEQITSGDYVLYITSIITYEDVFNMPHTTRFCTALTSDLTTFHSCNGYKEEAD
jgi:hypothetical protein